MKNHHRFQVRRDRDDKGRPEGWFVEDTNNTNVLRRFAFRKDAQTMVDEKNAVDEAGDFATDREDG